MRNAVVVLALLLILASPALAEPNYWVVILEDGATMDVVNAANFAASMKGSIATTFESRTDVQAREDLLHEDPDDVLLVLFAGNTLTIMEGEDEDFSDVVANVEAYADLQGFSVRYDDAEEFFNIETDVSTEREEIVCAQDAKECWDGSFVGRDPEDNCAFRACPQRSSESAPVTAPVKESTPEPASEPSSPSEDGPSIVVRVWRWFVGIFS